MKGNASIIFGAPRIDATDRREVMATLRSGWLGTGPRTARFESGFNSYVGARETVAVSSGTAALHLALIAAGVKTGGEVVTTPLTFAATANAILASGAVPRFADVDRVTQNITAESASRAVTRKTRAIIPVHLAGRPCDMDGIMALAKKRRLVVIEDAAHAIEGIYRGSHLGTIGDFGCFSFTPNKNLTTGEGGAVCVRRAGQAKAVRVCAGQGISANAWQRFAGRKAGGYQAVMPGFKYAMSDLNAAVGLNQLGKIEGWWRRRLAVWEYYTGRLRGLPVILPSSMVSRGRHALHLFTVHLELEHLKQSRNEMRRVLAGQGIGTGVHYESLHLHPYYRGRFGFKPADFPNAWWISGRTLSLPLSPHLTDAEVERVAETFRRVLLKSARSRR
jgi:dTDP-4-amino-4,6-dideoxygalactose transaminase